MGRPPCCDKGGLKKGPWTPEEDQKLLVYIEEHGHGSWRSLPDKAGKEIHTLLFPLPPFSYLSLNQFQLPTGLQRCGKSCRLRWTNYLRPDIKRGKFTLQEEQTIIQLHALLGNRSPSPTIYVLSFCVRLPDFRPDCHLYSWLCLVILICW